MIQKIFYNIFILGTIISICMFPILIFLRKNKYKYNIKNIYKMFLIILLLLFLPFNTFNFSKLKTNILSGNLEEYEQTVLNKNVENDETIKYQADNTIIEISENLDINVKNDIVCKIFDFLPYSWFTISIVLLTYNIFIYLVFVKKLKCITNENLDYTISRISKEINLKKKIICKTSKEISLPMTIGIFKQKIILPIEVFQSNNYEAILRHELFHIKNKDIVYKFLLLLLNCVYWFNPIIYNFTNQVNEILELNCDENVLQGKGKKYRVEYAEALLNQIEKSRNKQYGFSLSFANRRENIMNRFSNIVDTSNKKSAISLVTIFVILVMLALIAIICIPNINFATIKENNQIENIENKENNNVIQEEIDKPINQEKEMYATPTTEENNLKKIETEESLTEKRISTSKTIDESATVDITMNFLNPLKEYTAVEKKFGKINDGTHTGIDLTSENGNDILASQDGTVLFSSYKGSYGYLVVIGHSNKMQTYYAHCSKINVSQGQQVEKGQVIAEVGSTGNSTGPHLHFEIRKDRKAVNPEDYINF